MGLQLSSAVAHQTQVEVETTLRQGFYFSSLEISQNLLKEVWTELTSWATQPRQT